MRKVLRVLIMLIGASLGAAFMALILSAFKDLGFISAILQQAWLIVISYLLFCALGAFLFLLLTPPFFKLLDKLEMTLRKRPAADVLAGAIGLAIGLFLAFMLSQLIAFVPFDWLKISLSVLVYLLLGYMGVTVSVNRRHEFNVMASIRRALGRETKAGKVTESSEENLSMKLLDTSVIIDGRIFEICKAGFLEGKLIVPTFVLDELRTISDSEDDLKRSRGRRGLDILARLQNELARPVEVVNRDFSDLSDVDSKLLKLAAETGAKVITNDYNLNKVAKVQNIKVLNINELSNAVKPIALPGEEMSVKIVKPGKEQGQGVAYLEDGTMIVVEGGSRYIEDTVQIVVTSSLQTSAGRMIFGKLV